MFPLKIKKIIILLIFVFVLFLLSDYHANNFTGLKAVRHENESSFAITFHLSLRLLLLLSHTHLQYVQECTHRITHVCTHTCIHV